MVEFHDPTVVQQPISFADLTPLEHLVLTRIFDIEETGGGLLLHAALGPRESIAVSIGEVRTALAASASVPGRLVPFLSQRLPDAGVTDGVVAFDLSGLSWTFVLQDIVRRSPALPYVTAVTAFTCTAMRPDGFGGMAVLITADVIRSVSTNDILETWLADGVVRREHRLPRLVEDKVRAEVRAAIDADETLTRLAPEMVSDADIHATCRAVAANRDLGQEHGTARFRAALATIRAAERRLVGS
ncbi:hypothetical protein AZL_008120 [Azospirillum sp. B510]|uniref:hypothetical protein n=1 Tax=Azospirillum sp. (strain B510) TaxID=137722 RepID=UPI0001C4C2E0|nr:hypothetical protein [Azospirillum sp. B510]BAI71450.1 hypothetical protein AZL_008120 [Azospirillum sp. B510]